MNKIHVLVVPVLLGGAALLGAVAASKTAGVGTHAQSRSGNALVTARTRQLNRLERALHRSLRARPPALPPVPAVSRSRPQVAPRVVYQRPAPIVIVHHTSHHDDGGGEAEGGDGGGD